MPQSVKDVLANGTIIDIGKIGSSQYDYFNDIMYIVKGDNIEQIVRQIGHLVKKRLIPENEVYKLKLDILGKIRPTDIKTVIYCNNNNLFDILLLDNSKLVTEYQGRIYVKKIEEAFDATGDFCYEALLEFISEPFKKFILNPIK